MKYLLILAFCLPLFLLAQKDNIDILYVEEKSHEMTWYRYEPMYKADNIYDDLSEVKNEYVEQLMHSINSSTSFEWDLYNVHPDFEIEEKSPSAYQKMGEGNSEDNYMNLQFKIGFNDGNTDYAIVKFYLELKELGFSYPGIYVLENYENRWVMTTDYTDGIQLYLLYFDVDKLEMLFNNDTSDDKVNQLRDEISEKGSISLKLFTEVLNSWNVKPKNQEIIDYFFNY